MLSRNYIGYDPHGTERHPQPHLARRPDDDDAHERSERARPHGHPRRRRVPVHRPDGEQRRPQRRRLRRHGALAARRRLADRRGDQLPTSTSRAPQRPASSGIVATSSETIHATIDALSVAIAVGAYAGSGAGAGVDVVNQVGGSTYAYVQNSRGGTVSAGDAVIRATDSAGISADRERLDDRRSRLGAVGVSVAVGIAAAENTIATDVEAYVSSATLTTSIGAATIAASETASSTGTATASAVSVDVSLGGSISDAGAAADSISTPTVRAYVLSSTLNIAGALSVQRRRRRDDDDRRGRRVVPFGQRLPRVRLHLQHRVDGDLEPDCRRAPRELAASLRAGRSAILAIAGTAASATTSGQHVVGSASPAPPQAGSMRPRRRGARRTAPYISGASSTTTSTSGSISVIARHDVASDASFSPHDHAVTRYRDRDASDIAISLTAAHAGVRPPPPTPRRSSPTTPRARSAPGRRSRCARSPAPTRSPMRTATADRWSALGASNAFAYADGTVYTHFDGSITSAASLAVDAISVEGAVANATASGEGLYGGSDNSATVEVKPTDDREDRPRMARSTSPSRSTSTPRTTPRATATRTAPRPGSSASADRRRRRRSRRS